MEDDRRGAWPLIYHVAGNLAWFIPAGAMLRRRTIWAALRFGALLSASIEGLQWALATGIADVDDVLLNACGALVGWLLARALIQRAPAGDPKENSGGKAAFWRRFRRAPAGDRANQGGDGTQ